MSGVGNPGCINLGALGGPCRSDSVRCSSCEVYYDQLVLNRLRDKYSGLTPGGVFAQAVKDVSTAFFSKTDGDRPPENAMSNNPPSFGQNPYASSIPAIHPSQQGWCLELAYKSNFVLRRFKSVTPARLTDHLPLLPVQ